MPNNSPQESALEIDEDTILTIIDCERFRRMIHGVRRNVDNLRKKGSIDADAARDIVEKLRDCRRALGKAMSDTFGDNDELAEGEKKFDKALNDALATENTLILREPKKNTGVKGRNGYIYSEDGRMIGRKRKNH